MSGITRGRGARTALTLGLLCSGCEETAVSSEPGQVRALDAGFDAARGVLDAVPDAAAPSVVHDASTQLAWVVSDPSAQVAAWKAYTRKPEFDVVSADVRVPMRDGATLACRLSRPGHGLTPADGTYPGLVVETTPYVILGSFFAQEAAFFSARGYNTIVCTVRGVGGSDGSWQGAAGRQDRFDAHDLVEWLATQPFSNGRIGQFGESYGGGTSNGAAAERPPHLLAIAPLQSPSDLYDDINYPGGLETTRGGTINSWPPIAQLTSLFAIDANTEYDTWHAHPTYDSYWQDRAIASRLAATELPILTVGGWIDGYFRSGTLANVEAAHSHTWTFYGQWTHIYPIDLDACSGFVPCAEQPLPSGVLLAWFDRWLMQRATPVPEQPTFLSEEGPRGSSQGWRELGTWLGHDAPTTALQLGGDGTLSPIASNTQRVRFREPGDAAVTFSTAPLQREHVVLGHAQLALRAALDATDANFYVQLLDVDATDHESVVNDGFLKASCRDSKTNPTPVPVGQAIDYTLAIRPQHYRFAKGHRLRIRMWGGAPDTVVPPTSPVQVELETGAVSVLRLPGWELP